MQKSIKLLIIEYQKGHTRPMKKGHIFLFSKKWGGGYRDPVPPVPRPLRRVACSGNFRFACRTS